MFPTQETGEGGENSPNMGPMFREQEGKPIIGYEVKSEARVGLVKTQTRMFQRSFLRRYLYKALVRCLIAV